MIRLIVHVITDISADYTTGFETEKLVVQFPAKVWGLLHSVQTDSGANLAIYPSVARGLFRGSIASGAQNRTSLLCRG
jgi:hypothetical protein